MSPDSTLPSGSAPTMTRSGAARLQVAPAPLIVPPVPTATTRCVTRPSVWRQISGPVVRSWASRVLQVVVLVGLERARDVARQPPRDRVVALGRLGRHVRRAEHDLGAVRAQERLLLGRLLVGHHEDAAVALERRGDRQAVAGVAARGLDDRAARLEQAVALGRLDHRQADAVLDRAARVEHLELGEEQRLALARAEVARDAREAHERRLAHEVEDRLGVAHPRPSMRPRRGAHGRAADGSAPDRARERRKYGWCLRAPDFRFRGVPDRCRLRYRAHAIDPAVGRSRPVLLVLSATLLVTSFASATEVAAPDAARRPAEGRSGGRRGLTAITASLGTAATSDADLQLVVRAVARRPRLVAPGRSRSRRAARGASASSGCATTCAGPSSSATRPPAGRTSRPAAAAPRMASWPWRRDGDASAWAVGFTTFDHVQHPLVDALGRSALARRPAVGIGIARERADRRRGPGRRRPVGGRLPDDRGREAPARSRSRREKKRLAATSTRSAGRRESVTLTGIATDGKGRAVGGRTRRSGHDHGTGRVPPRTTGAGTAIGCRTSEATPSSPTSWQRTATTHGPSATSRTAPRCVRSSCTGTGATGQRSRAPRFDSDQAILTAVSVAPQGGIWVVGLALERGARHA